jgi:hypothetical protein
MWLHLLVSAGLVACLAARLAARLGLLACGLWLGWLLAGCWRVGAQLALELWKRIQNRTATLLRKAGNGY